MSVEHSTVTTLYIYEQKKNVSQKIAGAILRKKQSTGEAHTTALSASIKKQKAVSKIIRFKILQANG